MSMTRTRTTVDGGGGEKGQEEDEVERCGPSLTLSLSD